jgi:S-phase kinase-associated protein 1
MSTNIKLISSDGKVFTVSRSAAMASVLIKEMLFEDCDEDVQIPLPVISEFILSKVIEFMIYHENDPIKPLHMPLRTAILAENFSEWDIAFLTMEDDAKTTKFRLELIKAANYLDYSDLMHVVAAAIACMLKGCTPEEVCAKFNVPQVSQDRERQIIAENPWISQTTTT